MSSRPNDEMIEVTTLDEFCYKNEITQIDFLKIDVEGTELSVLRGATRLLGERKIRHIQFEFGDGHIEARTYLRDFFDILKDFSIYRIVNGGLVALPKYGPELEIFIPVNYFAVLNTRE